MDEIKVDEVGDTIILGVNGRNVLELSNGIDNVLEQFVDTHWEFDQYR